MTAMAVKSALQLTDLRPVFPRINALHTWNDRGIDHIDPIDIPGAIATSAPARPVGGTPAGPDDQGTGYAPV
jgi:hypothetical protein